MHTLLPEDQIIAAEFAQGPVGEPAYDAYVQRRLAGMKEKAARVRRADQEGREHFDNLGSWTTVPNYPLSRTGCKRLSP